MEDQETMSWGGFLSAVIQDGPRAGIPIRYCIAYGLHPTDDEEEDMRRINYVRRKLGMEEIVRP
jgi:hypothetical protein